MIYCFWISKEILFSSSFFLFFLLVSLITSFLKIQFVFCTLISFFSPHSSFMYFECQVSKPGKVFGSKTWMGFGAVKKKWKKFFFLFLFEAFTFALHPRLSWPAINCHRCVFSFSVFECNSEKETYFVLENRPRMHSECFAKSKFYFWHSREKETKNAKKYDLNKCIYSSSYLTKAVQFHVCSFKMILHCLRLVFPFKKIYMPVVANISISITININIKDAHLHFRIAVLV